MKESVSNDSLGTYRYLLSNEEQVQKKRNDLLSLVLYCIVYHRRK
jgi:hypothetical protein